jgi:hypothetical protein
VKAAVPADKLDQLAEQTGVAEVRLPDRAVPMAVTSEGVGLSKANLWIADGKTMTRCLDVVDGGTADLTPVGLWECNGNEAQQWVTRPGGALVNPVSDKCLDAGTNGNDMVLKQCSGALSQRWALLARSA